MVQSKKIPACKLTNIVFIFWQVRCIIRNIVRDWTKEVAIKLSHFDIVSWLMLFKTQIFLFITGKGGTGT